MRLWRVLFVVLAVAASLSYTVPGHALEIRKSVLVDKKPDAVWALIGDFCAISEWHPLVEECALSSRGALVRRVLRIAGGSVVQERLASFGSYSYSTQFEGGGFPVRNYSTTLEVYDADDASGGTVITWSSEFDANGASSEEARKVISAIMTSGLLQIKRQVNAQP